MALIVAFILDMNTLRQVMRHVSTDALIRYMRIMVLFILRCRSNEDRLPLNSAVFRHFAEARDEFFSEYGSHALSDAFVTCDQMDAWFAQNCIPGFSKYDIVNHIIRTASSELTSSD
jgi:hypothetical protein